MTRELAHAQLLQLRGPAEHRLFEEYAQEAERYEGSSFWNSFSTIVELLRDFELYVRYHHRARI